MNGLIKGKEVHFDDAYLCVAFLFFSFSTCSVVSSAWIYSFFKRLDFSNSIIGFNAIEPLIIQLESVVLVNGTPNLFLYIFA